MRQKNNVIHTTKHAAKVLYNNINKPKLITPRRVTCPSSALMLSVG